MFDVSIVTLCHQLRVPCRVAQTGPKIPDYGMGQASVDFCSGKVRTRAACVVALIALLPDGVPVAQAAAILIWDGYAEYYQTQAACTGVNGSRLGPSLLRLCVVMASLCRSTVIVLGLPLRRDAADSLQQPHPNPVRPACSCICSQLIVVRPAGR